MSGNSMQRPVKAVIVGGGHRSVIYASYAERHPDELVIVGVVDPDATRRELVMKRFGLSETQSFESVQQLVSSPKVADAVINGTMDELHVATTLPLLEAGYDVLLEKPIGVSEEEVLSLQEAARKHGRIVMICHVLRYAPFYRAIKEKLAEDTIGEIMSIQTSEHVRYDHMAVSFVRGKWSSEEQCKSSMLMAKCCHDLDLITWLIEGHEPRKVSSFGGLMYFRPEKAPEGSGTRCLTDCQIEETCPYSARKHYLEMGKWGFYVWPNVFLGSKLTMEEKLELLRTESPYGRCVWRCDNDVVDHQSVMVEFSNGATATHNMVGGAPVGSRTIHLIGTKGEIKGVLEEGSFVIRHPDPRPGKFHSEQVVSAGTVNDSHGGGNLLLVQDFVRALRGERPSLSSTSLDRSITGHLIGFAAERSRASGGQVMMRGES